MLQDEKGDTDRAVEGSNSTIGSDQLPDSEIGELPTLFESKAKIIDQELNRYGMGRYQW